MDLLSLMEWSPPPMQRRPIWRAGRAVPGSDAGYVPHRTGDLRWLTVDATGRGRWFEWDAKRAEWICLDPADVTGINDQPDHPPARKIAA